MPRPPTDPLTTSMADLVRVRDASVRLTNCVCGDNWLAQQTVRDFIEGGAPLFDKILKVQNLGRKTATELRQLINRHVIDSGGLEEVQRQTPVDLSVDGDPPYGPPVPTPFQSLMDILDPIGFPEVVTSFDISTRLRHHLQQFAFMQAIEGRWEAEILSVADVLRRWSDVTSHFLGAKNFGRRSLSELRATIETVIARRLEWSDAAHSTSDAVSVESIAKGNLEPELAALIEEARNARIKRPLRSDDSACGELENDDHWLAVDPTLVNLPPREQVARVIAALADKEKDVILRRFGIGGFAPQTLEEIATKFFVTRERVRQVEARALKRLRLKGRAAAFQRLLETEQDSVWEFLAERKAFFSRPICSEMADISMENSALRWKSFTVV